MARWLVKTEPQDYSFDDLSGDGKTAWDGVRGHQARASLKRMRVRDQVLVYHSGKMPAVVGTGEVVRDAYSDPLDPGGVVVDIAARRRLDRPVTLREIKDEQQFGGWALVRQSRLSVMEVPDEAWDWIIDRAGR